MMHGFLAMLQKDLFVSLGRGSNLVQALLLGLLLIFLFSLSVGTGEKTTPQAAAAIFWMATLFCQVLIFSTLYGFEETNGQRQGLLLAPIPIQVVWLGKMVTGLIIITLAQLIFFPAIIVFLHQTIAGSWVDAIIIIALVNVGACAVGSLLGALSQGQNTKESLLSLIVFPLLLPLLLAGISALAEVFANTQIANMASWFQLAGAFDAIFLGAAFMLFPFLYNVDN